ncbi:MAG TPA: Gx transporter family protein [Bacillota bacterium]|nr:Gx transporter family protein [Bacillota bacterium]HOK64259.1 Gx transporter family protein [Bacillota bacterium]HOL11877.1 Gx transporter family protein [Bacillota bacterium]HOQ02879.1 Gx transporter family protein [Bacillota bacterium]HPP60702.1 Gx transporter family protein [Bacillota bacterium]
MKRDGVYRLTNIAIMVALATALHVVEAMIPIPYVVPGAKLGLANIVALYAVMTGEFSDAFAVSFLRTLLGSLLSGTFLNVGYYLSTAGALLSTTVMYALNKLAKGTFSAVGISVAGSITHNVAQLLVASLLLEHIGVMFYLPYLLLFAIPTGIFVGLLAGKIVSYTEKVRNKRRV